MDNRIRISDADRERVTARLRDHYAEGRLSPEELDERISAALSAKTYGDLRRVMADLPDSAPPAPQAGPAGPAGQVPPWAMRRGPAVRRGPRILPLAIFALIVALVIPGAGWLFLVFFKLILLFWLVACLAGMFAMARFRRHMRRHWQSGEGNYWHHFQWRG